MMQADAHAAGRARHRGCGGQAAARGSGIFACEPAAGPVASGMTALSVLIAELLKLPFDDRAELAEILRESLDDDDPAEIESGPLTEDVTLLVSLEDDVTPDDSGGYCALVAGAISRPHT